MAITRDKKNTLVAELSDLFSSAKGAVGAVYSGLSVSQIQKLRREARSEDVTIKVVKNRLVRVALSQSATFKEADTSSLKGQLLYAFSESDEVAPAQVLAKFAKSNPELKLVLGFDATGLILDESTVRELSELPTKDQLKGQLVSVLSAPLTKFLSISNGTQRSFVQVLSQKSEQ